MKQQFEAGNLNFIVTEAGKLPGFLDMSFSPYAQKTEMEGYWIWRKGE